MKKTIILFFAAVNLFIMMSCSPKSLSIKSEGPSISGKVFSEDGAPLKDAVVSVYLSNTSMFHGPDNFRSGLTKEDGSFSINLPDGKYFLIARKRIFSNPTGPLKKGDYNGEFSDNPVHVKSGKTNKIQIIAKKIDGLMLFSPMQATDKLIKIKGIVRDEKSNPMKGFYAVAYINPLVQGKPYVISKPTNEKGEFVLFVPGPGKYYILARDKFRKPPVAGEKIGAFEGSEDNSIEIKDNDGIEGINIVIKTMTVEMMKHNIFLGIKTQKELEIIKQEESDYIKSHK